MVFISQQQTCMRRAYLWLVLLALGLLLFSASTAAATSRVFATANVNMRTGPSTKYPIIGQVPKHGNAILYQCTAGYTWCDVSYSNLRGWVSAKYLIFGSDSPYPSQSVPTYAPYVSLPVIYSGYPIYPYYPPVLRPGLSVGVVVRPDHDDDHHHHRPPPPPPHWHHPPHAHPPHGQRPPGFHPPHRHPQFHAAGGHVRRR